MNPPSLRPSKFNGQNCSLTRGEKAFDYRVVTQNIGGPSYFSNLNEGGFSENRKI